MYEYIFKLWRGAADQKTANNITALASEPEKFEPVSTEKWEAVLEQIFTQSSIEGVDISQALMKPLLYHFYCLKCISGPDTDYDIEVDHIIPQSLFAASSIKRSDVIQHNILNLGLLPKSENVAKSNKRLVEIIDPWLKDQITKYEFIAETDFAKYSDISNYQDMFEYRKSIIIDAYKDARTHMLNN